MFEHLKKYEVAETSWLSMPELGPDAQLCLRNATEKNQPLLNELIRRQDSSRRRAAGARMSGEDLARARADDRDVYPRFIFHDWKGVLDTDGNDVPFSVGAAQEMCEQLPDWLFDKIRSYCGSPERFVDLGDLVPN